MKGEVVPGSGSPSLKNLTTGGGAKAWGGWCREEMGAPESSMTVHGGGEGEGVWKWYQGRRE